MNVIWQANLYRKHMRERKGIIKKEIWLQMRMIGKKRNRKEVAIRMKNNWNIIPVYKSILCLVYLWFKITKSFIYGNAFCRVASNMLPLLLTFNLIIIIITIIIITSTNLCNPLSPPISIIHCSWNIFKATSYIGTELLYIGSS